MCPRIGRVRASVVALMLSALALLVAPARVSAQGATTILDRVEINPRRPIDFHAVALPESVYVGQQATYQVAVLLSPEARSRLRRNPEFLPPELRGLLAYELGTPTRVPPRTMQGAVFEAHIFQRALFPVASGRQTVPAPQLSYTLPQSSSYFSREERFVVRAESASFVVRPLPLDGRPEDFNGAVGVLTSSVRIDTTSARVGDPLVMTLRVQGTGNVKLLPRPAIELDWASVVPGSERIQVDSSGPLVRGVKEFDWILTPARDGRVAVPPLRYSYFDPYQGRYAVALSAPVDLGVGRGSLADAEEGESGALMPLRSGALTPAPVPLWNGYGMPPTSLLAWLAALLCIPALGMWLTRSVSIARASSANASAMGTTAERAAMTRAQESAVRVEARTARREFTEAIGARLGHAPQSLISRQHLARLLRRSGVTRQTTRDAIALLDTLDELAYAVEDVGADATTRTSSASRSVPELMRRIGAEAMPAGRSVARSVTVPLLVLCALTLSAVSSSPMLALPQIPSQAVQAPRPVAASERRAAQDAYQRRAFIEAMQRFAGLAARAPHDAEILTNWGTAAWAAGDTVAAVIAWQRAARIEPLAADLQERIASLPSGARGGIADVPMVPVSLLVRIAIALWIVGWSAHVARRWYAGRRGGTEPSASHGWLRVLANVAIVVAVCAAGAAWWGARALDPSQLAVVSRPETLRVAPGVDADAMGGVATGDVVRIEESRDIWRRVVHADGRRGWLPAPRLVRLTPDSTDAARGLIDANTPVSARERAPGFALVTIAALPAGSRSR